jgi:hypothetical protein
VIPVGAAMSHLLSARMEPALYFLDTAKNRVGRINLKQGALEIDNDAIAAKATGLCLTPNGKKLYLCSADKVQCLDAATLKIDKTFNLDRGKPIGIQATDAGFVFLNGGEGQWTNLYVLNANKPAGNAKVAAFAGVFQQSAMQLTPDQKQLFAVGFNTSPASFTCHWISERPDLIRGRQCGTAPVTAGGTRGNMYFSRDGGFMLCDNGQTFVLGK